jgi:hypothetical protein
VRGVRRITEYGSERHKWNIAAGEGGGRDGEGRGRHGGGKGKGGGGGGAEVSTCVLEECV